MKKIIFLIIFALPCLATAQKSETNSSDSLAIKRNEIWLNVLPMVATMAQMPFDKPLFSLMYKRNSGNLWMRAGGFVSPSINYLNFGHTTLISDSLLQVKVSEQTAITTGGRLGVEFRRKYKVFSTFAGADLLYQYSRRNTNFYYSYYSTYGLPDFPIMEKELSIFEGSSGRKYNQLYQSHFGGIGIVGGVILPLSNRFSMSAQAYVSLGYSYDKTLDKNYENGSEFKDTRHSFEFNQHVIQEVNLVYKF